MSTRTLLGILAGLAAAATVACLSPAYCGEVEAGGGDRPPAQNPDFERPPGVAKHGDGFVVDFAVKSACDATVAVLDKDGRVVRHLASGVLGENAPEPFKKGSLAQEIVWDGKDDAGKPVAAGAVVRVSLGLRPEFARMLCEAQQGLSSRGPIGLAVDKKGVLYVEEGDLWIQGLGAAGVIQVLSVKAFDGDGNYVRTLVPFRADWPHEKVSEVEFLTTKDGRRIPLSGPSKHRPYCGFARGAPATVRNLPVITSDGRMIYLCGKDNLSGARRFISIGTDGSAPKDRYEGPRMQEGASSLANTFMALSLDEKYIYYGGARSRRGKGTALCHAIYRVGLDDKEPAKAFIGKEFETGKADGQFNDPRGVEVDAKGRIWVGDYANDRIQVFDAEGKFLKTFDVPGPEQVRVSPKTGAAYVLSVRDRGATSSYGSGVVWENIEDKSVIKFASLDDWREVARIDLPKRKRHMHDAGPMMVLDATREEAFLWIASVGRQDPEDFLWKVADRGDKLEKVAHKVVRYNRQAFNSPPLAADRRNNEVYAFGTPAGNVRVNAETGEVRNLALSGDAGKAALSIVGAASVGPEGLLYIRSAKMLEKNERAWFIRRFDRKGELVPFGKAGESIETNGKQAGTPWNEQATPFAVGPDGRIYSVAAYSRQGRNCRMDVFGPEGDMVKPGFISMTRSGGCVRIDNQGRLYAADTVRPKDKALPDCYSSDPRGHLSLWYGTVFRFDPAGGGLAPAPAAEATYQAGGLHEGLKPVVIKGALWGFHGLSPMPLQTGCQCTMADFDADDWGRVWVPDAPGYCVAVLDSAGNVITRFGAYGNRDATGAGGLLPEPPIPLWSPERVAVLDNDAFVADTLSCRIVQVKLKCWRQAEVPVP